MKILKNIANNHFSIQCISESKLGWYCIRSHIRPKFLNKSFNRYQPCVATPASDAQEIIPNCGQLGHMFTFCSHWQISMAKVDKSKMKCNKPRRTPDGPKKFVVKACEGSKKKIIRYGDISMRIKKSNPECRKSVATI